MIIKGFQERILPYNLVPNVRLTDSPSGVTESWKGLAGKVIEKYLVPHHGQGHLPLD